MKIVKAILLSTFMMFLLIPAAEGGWTLGSAAEFSILASSTVTNTGLSVIDGGNIGLSSGTSITGFPSGILNAPYTFQTSDALTTQAHTDLSAAISGISTLVSSQDMTGQDLGGLTLTPGVYSFASSAQLTGTLTLNGLGDPNALFVFRIASTLTTSSDSSIVMMNGGSSPASQVFWQVGSSATLGTNSTFAGNILATANITLTTGATIVSGSALALDGQVTLDSNRINTQTSLNPVPEPSTVFSLAVGLILTGLGQLRRVGGKGRSGFPGERSN